MDYPLIRITRANLWYKSVGNDQWGKLDGILSDKFRNKHIHSDRSDNRTKLTRETPWREGETKPHEYDRRQRLAQLEHDTVLRSLRRLLEPGGAAHSHPYAAPVVPWAHSNVFKVQYQPLLEFPSDYPRRSFLENNSEQPWK